jgi:hypothetical protein
LWKELCPDPKASMHSDHWQRQHSRKNSCGFVCRAPGQRCCNSSRHSQDVI